MSKERILDLGVGMGGTYIDLDDAEQTLRFGIDRHPIRLEHLQIRYPEIILCKSNLKGPITPTLPYAPRSFDRVEMQLPHDELLYWLTDDSQNLWDEFKRVLKPEGAVVVIFDVPPDGKRTLKVKSLGETLEVQNPEDRVWRQALNGGFEVKISPFSEKQVYEMGSYYGKRAADWIRETEGDHKVYILHANLQPQNL